MCGFVCAESKGFFVFGKNKQAWTTAVAIFCLVGAGWLGMQGMGDLSTPLVGRGSDELAYQRLRADTSHIGGNWLRTLNPAVQDVQGDLVWSNKEQAGVMRFINLPEPRKGFRYHVWIYDSHRVNDQAVSGAILGKGSGRQELFVPLAAASPVVAPYKFVLTQESDSDEGNDKTEARILLMVQP